MTVRVLSNRNFKLINLTDQLLRKLVVGMRNY